MKKRNPLLAALLATVFLISACGNTSANENMDNTENMNITETEDNAMPTEVTYEISYGEGHGFTSNGATSAMENALSFMQENLR